MLDAANIKYKRMQNFLLNENDIDRGEYFQDGDGGALDLNND